MKKTSLFSAAIATALLASCGGVGGEILNTVIANSQAGQAASSVANAGANTIGSILQTATSGQNLGNIIASVIGLDKMTKADLIGTWRYNRPGVAFTSEKTLANAGGEVIAASVKEKLQGTYQKVGIKADNTQFAFNQDGTFVATVLGKTLQGTYTFDEKTQAISMKTLLFSFNGYVKKNTDGIALLFESKKILSIIQTIGAASGNSTLSTIGDISSNYDGVRVGFDVTK